MKKMDEKNKFIIFWIKHSLKEMITMPIHTFESNPINLSMVML